MSLDAVTEEALNLPIDGRVVLVEKLLSSLAAEPNIDLEREHLKEIEARRAGVASGANQLIDGPEALRRARAALAK